MTILLAGATGALGGRIARELRLRDAEVKAIVRRGTAPDKVARLQALGVTVLELDPDDVSEVTAACRGAACVVSALNGVRPVIIDTQGVLLRSAVAAGVPRFIPSDFSLDFTKTTPGSNRNLDLRRDFHKLLDAAPIRATSIFNGGFMELLAGQAPFLLFKTKRVLYFGEVDQQLDFTTMDDVAAFTAEAALDPTTPRVLRIAGDQVSARDLAAIAGRVTGTPFKTLRAGSLGVLATVIRLLRAVAPGSRSIFPPWQGMQYMHNMFSGDGKLSPIDNARYPALRWTSVAAVLGNR